MRRHRILPGLLIAIALVGASCGSDNQDEQTATDTTTQVAETEPSDPPVTDPPATNPPATDPPSTEPPATDPPTTEPPATDPPTTEPAQPVGSGVRTIVETLAADELDGRNNQTDGSTRAQDFLANEIAMFSNPLSEGGYLLPYVAGTNVVGIVPGASWPTNTYWSAPTTTTSGQASVPVTTPKTKSAMVPQTTQLASPRLSKWCVRSPRRAHHDGR